MTLHTSPALFFGVDLSPWVHEVAVAWRQMQDWRVLRWLSPSFVTHAQAANGLTVALEEQPGNIGRPSRADYTKRFFGVVIPDEMVLWREMQFPLLSDEGAEKAIELEACSVSPFPQSDLAWGHMPIQRHAGMATTRIAIVSRKLISTQMQAQTPAPHTPSNPEVWVQIQADQRYLLIEGFGEPRRRALEKRWRNVNWGLAFLLLMVALAAAITPTAQLRLRALQAADQYAKVQAIAAPALQKREQQIQFDQQGKILMALMDKALEPQDIMLRLTQIVPDDTYLTSIRAQAGKVVIAGLAPNTATFMQHLGAQPGVKEVKSPVPATKQRGAERESFTIELVIEKPVLSGKP